jgi:hypothetical protein
MAEGETWATIPQDNLNCQGLGTSLLFASQELRFFLFLIWGIFMSPGLLGVSETQTLTLTQTL